MTSAPTIISKVFSGLFFETFTCTKHKNPKPFSEYYTQEVLELDMESTLGKSLNDNFAESVETRKCKVCKKKTEHKCVVRIHYAPPVLALKILRTEDDNSAFNYPL